MRTGSIALALGCAIIATAAAAQTPPDLVDLIGARAGQAENTVTSRGYAWSRTMKTGGSTYSYWTRGGDCVQITTTDGRYVGIDKMDRSLCRADDAASSEACPADVSQADRYKYPACDAQQAKPQRDACPADVSQADRYKYPACN